MGRPVKDRIGQTFGHLRVCALAGVKEGNAHWCCTCACGNNVVVAANSLQSGTTKSCGCLHGIHISNPVTHKQLKRLLRYDSKTGIFYWRVLTRGGGKLGQRAGCVSAGYVKIKLNSKTYPAHRLARFYKKGVWPTREVDHRDVTGTNNAWTNLRAATRRQNARNTKVRRDNVVGYKGVSKHKAKFIARACCKGKRVYLGIFDTAILAAQAYDIAVQKYHGNFARPNFVGA